MSSPPLPIGTMVSTPTTRGTRMEFSAPTVRYAGVIANLTGNPAMSVPLHWNDDGMPIGVHFLASFGDEATLFRLAAQLEEHSRGTAECHRSTPRARPPRGCSRKARLPELAVGLEQF